MTELIAIAVILGLFACFGLAVIFLQAQKDIIVDLELKNKKLKDLLKIAHKRTRKIKQIVGEK